jgi:hypothetical protein
MAGFEVSTEDQDQARAALLSEADTFFPSLGLDDLVAFERQHVPSLRLLSLSSTARFGPS